MVASRRPPDAVRCPRCDSAETKFCYYNNYNTSQPRHFCKTCKRYWTAGGTLRNVPVGGGLRKNKKAIKDMIQFSSADELFHGNLPPPYAFLNDSLAYDAPRPLSFAPPLFMASSTSSSADAAGNGTLANPLAFRHTNPLDSAYFAESYGNGIQGMNPPRFNSHDVRHYAHFHGDPCNTFPNVLEHQKNGGLECFRRPMALDQTELCSGDVSEVRLELSQASSEALKEPQMAHSAVLQAVHVEQGGPMVIGMGAHQIACEHDPSLGTLQTTTEGRSPGHISDGQCRDRSSTEGEDDELGNVVNVRYPYDWEQVSEVLFGGTPDFFQLPGY